MTNYAENLCIANSKAQRTRKPYVTARCDVRKRDSTPLTEISDFLSNIYKSGLEYNTINMAIDHHRLSFGLSLLRLK